MPLEDVFASVFGVNKSDLEDTTSQTNMANWSSLSHIELVLSLEEIYNVSFDREEIPLMKSLGYIRRLLQEKGVHFEPLQ